MSEDDHHPQWRRLSANAEDFRFGASVLLQNSGTREQHNVAFPASILVLIGFAWELFFKSYLAKCGVPQEKLKSYGHNLIALRRAVEAKGWSFVEAVENARQKKQPVESQPARDTLFESADAHFVTICEMTSTATAYQARYPTQMNMIPWPEVQLEILAHEIETL